MSDYDIDNNVSVITKTDVTILSDLQTNGFNVTATLGNDGEEYAVWSNVHFGYDTSHSPAVFSGNRWWPGTNPGYHFSASTATMTHTPSGETVTVSNTQDVVCAYLRYPQYRNVNTLTFEHIFARLCNVTVNATDGYTISNVNIQLIPKTGGTYNISQGANLSDRTGWSSFTNGMLTTVSNNAVTITTSNTKSNDIYLVPGTYEVSLAWTATKGEYTQNYSQIYCEVDLSSGKRNNLTFNLNGNAKDIEFTVSIEPWVSDSTSLTANDFSKPPVTFGGLEIAPAPLYYDGENFVIKDDDWNHSSYYSVYGKNEGSYFFSFTDLASYFDSDGVVTNGIDNTNTISYNGYDDWRLPTRAEFSTLLSGSSPGVSRIGSTVNGTNGWKYSGVRMNSLSYAGQGVTLGYLVFPDGEEFTGQSLTYRNTTGGYTSLTNAQFQEYLDQGCLFFPLSGRYVNQSGGYFTQINNYGYYYTCTYALEKCWFLNLGNGTSNGVSSGVLDSNYCMVRLVRSVN